MLDFLLPPRLPAVRAARICRNGSPMILIAISFPLGLLCLYLGCLGWRKNKAAGAALLLFAAINIGLALALAAFFFLFSQQLS